MSRDEELRHLEVILRELPHEIEELVKVGPVDARTAEQLLTKELNQAESRRLRDEDLGDLTGLELSLVAAIEVDFLVKGVEVAFFVDSDDAERGRYELPEGLADLCISATEQKLL